MVRQKKKQAEASSINTGGRDGRQGSSQRKPNESEKSNEPYRTVNRRTNNNDNNSGNNNDNRNNSGRNRRNNNNTNRNQRNRTSDTTTVNYPPHLTLEQCMARYESGDETLIRGTLRVLPGTTNKSSAFCTCDRGNHAKDIHIPDTLDINRGMDGDTVYVELYEEAPVGKVSEEEVAANEEDLGSDDGGDIVLPRETDEPDELESFWQDDPVQMGLWAPIVQIRRRKTIKDLGSNSDETVDQRKGRVVHVVLPRQNASEINPTVITQTTHRVVVGTLKKLQSGTVLLICTNKSMPQFFCSAEVMKEMQKFRSSKKDSEQASGEGDEADSIFDSIFFQAKYKYGSWAETGKWPPCTNLEPIGEGGSVEDETAALLISNGVNHGEFPPCALAECGKVVASGEYEGGWKPTPEMYEGRRDYRNKRIFTIDPTTAKDLDDALHVDLLDNGQVEIGVHIADVTHFVTPGSEIDREAQRRCTTVYLVDRVLPMLPRPLCEIACSLNENVERLAFSCVWRMNLDGTVLSKDGKGSLMEENPSCVWYGRSVIKSCARLDYSTAQNIIDDKVCAGEAETDEELWPRSRRPTCGHTMEQVAADVRLMNKVAQARRKLRFANGALALSAVKLTFQLGDDGETPTMMKPYPIRDSNRLVEEYMLLANYLVAQRLITHAGEKALIRHHEAPIQDGIKEVGDVAKAAMNFDIDTTNSQSLQTSLNRLGLECRDPLVLQCITEMLKTPFKPANYIVTGEIQEQPRWAHFALNIPYYTHFTSPIRRYADVMVHRMLQATIDDTVDEVPYDFREIGKICGRCNEKKDASRLAQDRSDEVFLALYLRRRPLKSQLGVVLSVGKNAFKVYVPSLGKLIPVFLEEHKSWISWEWYLHQQHDRIRLTRKAAHGNAQWEEISIKVFAKVQVTCTSSDRPPIQVKLHLEGPWAGE